MSEGTLHIAGDFPPTAADAWRKLVEKDLKGKPFEVLVTELEPGISLSPLYTAADAVSEARTGFPGTPPFVRGTATLGRSERGWSICQEYDDPRMEAAAEAIARDLDRGADAIWIRLGTDHGVRVLTAADLEAVLRSVKLDVTPIHLEPETALLPVASALVAVADARGTDRAKLRGCLGADPLASLARIGSLPSGIEAAVRHLVEAAFYAREHLPGMRAALVSSRPYSDAGATIVDELAWSIATGLEYVRKLVEAGLSVDEAAGQLVFAYSVGGHFFAEIAKLRAARLLWSKVMNAAGASPAAQAMVIHARTATFTKSQRDPWVNMLRGTAESFAAAVGGADSISTSPFDEAVGPSDDFARRIARNTQIILRDESSLHRVVDPAGGSYYLEKLTDQLARAAWAELQKVEELGGMGRALQLGHIGRAVEEARNARLAALKKRKTPVVGVSEFPNLGEEAVTRPAVDMNEVEGELGNAFGSANTDQRRSALMDFARIAQSSNHRKPGDLVAHGVAAAALGVDFFSMTQALNIGQPSVYVEPLRPFRQPMVFEMLRDASDRYLAAHGRRPKAFLANLGTIAQHTARATWTQNALAAGGVESVSGHGFADAAAALEAFVASGADMAVIAGPDDLYPEWVPVLAPQLRAKGAKVVAVAGKGGEHEAAFREKGVDLFVFAGADLFAIHTSLHEKLGVTE